MRNGHRDGDRTLYHSNCDCNYSRQQGQKRTLGLEREAPDVTALLAWWLCSLIICVGGDCRGLIDCLQHLHCCCISDCDRFCLHAESHMMNYSQSESQSTFKLSLFEVWIHIVNSGANGSEGLLQLLTYTFVWHQTSVFIMVQLEGEQEGRKKKSPPVCVPVWPLGGDKPAVSSCGSWRH